MQELPPTNPFTKPTDSALQDIEAAIQGLARKAKRQDLVRPSVVHRSSGSRSGSGDRFLSETVSVAAATGSPASAVSWTTFNAAPYIPGSARGVILQCRGRSIDSPTGEKAVNVRKESGAIELQVVSVRGTTTSDITSMTNQCKCEVTGSRTFDYEITAMTEYDIDLVGYY